jgi:hypothetical protein
MFCRYGLTLKYIPHLSTMSSAEASTLQKNQLVADCCCAKRRGFNEDESVFFVRSLKLLI